VNAKINTNSLKVAALPAGTASIKVDMNFKNPLQTDDEIIKEIGKNCLEYQSNGDNITVKCNKEQYLKLKDDLKNIYGENLIISEPEIINTNFIELNIIIQK
jgi:hypothetical protein